MDGAGCRGWNAMHRMKWMGGLTVIVDPVPEDLGLVDQELLKATIELSFFGPIFGWS